jgi:hypothetical protein
MKIFKTLKELAYFLEYSERTNPNFWLFTVLFVIILNFLALNLGYSIQSPTTKPSIEKTVAGQTALRICGGDGVATGGFPSYTEQKISKIRSSSDKPGFVGSIGKKILLEKLFPDWPERVDFQNKQQKFFESGRKKQISAKRVRRKIQLTPEEQDAFNYFSRTGFYKNYQSSKTSPNIFDTRESFLKKMNNREMRTNFLNSYNNRFKKNN